MRLRLSAALMALALLIGVNLIGLGANSSVAVAAPRADAATSNPTPLSSTPLPTAQIDGVVWNQAVSGDTVYAGGSFSKARPAGASLTGSSNVTRKNLMAYSLSTGVLTSFAPSVDNGEVKNLVVSGSTLYVVGTFTSINSQKRDSVAAFDIPSGKLLPFAPDLNGPAYGVQVLNGTVYVVGGFNTAYGVGRTKAAAFSPTGGLTSWAPKVSGGDVRQLVISPDKTRIVLGGSFTSVDGSTQGFGLARVSVDVGTTLYPMGINNVVRSGATFNSGIYDLASDSTGFYGTSWGNSPTLEGSFKADWTNGNVTFLEDCHGDSYSIYPTPDVVYTASHAHYCGNVGSFGQTAPEGHAYAMAWTNAAEGSISTDPTHYVNWGGTPRPDALAFYPDFTAGTYTHQNQATWDVAGSGNYVLYAGEFTKVNGVAQQGLVRFLTKSAQPSTDKPVAPNGWAPQVRDFADGQAWVSWPAIRDRDNTTVNYQLIKNGNLVGPVSTATAAFWALPRLGFLDTGLVDGESTTYHVRATDPDGNVTTSNPLITTYTEGRAATSYNTTVLSPSPQDQSTPVLSASPQYYWSAGSASPVSTAPALDLVGSGKPVVDSGVRSVSPGALGAGSSAFSFNGTNRLAAPTAQLAPNIFTIDAWFKTTTTSGGAIINMGNSQTGDSANYDSSTADPSNPDRTIYLSPSGLVNFGVWARGPHTITTTKAYNDGQWHQAVATMDLSGMKFYVDGALVGTAPATYAGINVTGYWRVGGDTLTGWPGNPNTGYYTGLVDQIAIYRTALSADQISAQYAARG